MKEYKTNEELIKHLLSKNVVVHDKEAALDKIETYTYYSIVNSYKSIFKDENNNYKKGVSFEEIYALFDFDKNIKYIFLKYSLEIEMKIKSLMANQISKQYGVKDYLNISNLDEHSPENVRNKLIEKINKEIEDDYKVHSAITHYKDKYGFIPPFVLSKILTLGVVSSYYGLLKQNDRQAIAKHFKMSDKLLKQTLKNLTMVRNISAHSDCLYTFRSKFNMAYKEIDKEYVREDNFTNLYMMINAMKYFLNEEQQKDFVNSFSDELYKLKCLVTSVDINEFLKAMGFPENNL